MINWLCNVTLLHAWVAQEAGHCVDFARLFPTCPFLWRVKLTRTKSDGELYLNFIWKGRPRRKFAKIWLFHKTFVNNILRIYGLNGSVRRKCTHSSKQILPYECQTSTHLFSCFEYKKKFFNLVLLKFLSFFKMWTFFTFIVICLPCCWMVFFFADHYQRRLDTVAEIRPDLRLHENSERLRDISKV